VAAGIRVKKFEVIARVAQKKLRILRAALRLEHLVTPAGNRLETLSGDRKGQHSIRINDQYRICFTWKEGYAYEVEIVDYKTGRAKKETEARRDLQLSIYAIAAKEILELNPVRLVFHYLQNNERQETARDSKQLDEAQKIVQGVASEIRAGSFPPKPGPFQCKSCAYQPICPAHEENLANQES